MSAGVLTGVYDGTGESTGVASGEVIGYGFVLPYGAANASTSELLLGL